MKSTNLLVSFLIAVALGGCASTPQTSRPPPQVFEKSKQVFGSDQAILIWVPNRGAIADATFSGMSVVAPLPISREIARVISSGTNRQVALAVAGANSGKTRRVITDALALQTEPLPGLRLLFIGDTSDRDVVRAAVEGRGARFFFESSE